MSFFANASGTVINGGTFVHKDDASRDLRPLYDKVAPNAILNSGSRTDPVRCHPGTREEVIEKMEKRIAANHTEERGVFWLSGPAGAGKSAIMQTIAERCNERKIPMANFFFFRADNTRNHSGPVVATLLYQLFNLFPPLSAHVAAIASKDPVVFRQSMPQQFSTLIEKSLQAIRPSSEDKPVVILIDGLDECSTGNGRDDQVSLLNILHDMSLRSIGAGFIVLVASRTEAHLTTTFNEIGYHPASIYLDESYRPSADIRAFLIHQFSRIKQTHNLRDILPNTWPPSSDIDAIVEKSSGQFVYPATVTRYISSSAASPKHNLEIVLGLRLPMKTSPFAKLDSLYIYILSQAEGWVSVQDILAAQKIITSWKSPLVGIAFLLQPLGYAEDDILSSLADLTSIIRFWPGDTSLTVYHASLNDFLFDKHRAGDFYVDVNAFACRLAPLHFRQMANLWDLESSFQILASVSEPDQQLTEFLKSFLPNPKLFPSQTLQSYQQQYTREIFACLLHDSNLHKHIVDRWQKWFSILHNLPTTSMNGGFSERPNLPAQGSYTVFGKTYCPSDDIRCFLIEEFSMIKRTHSLRDVLPQDWPLCPDMDAIVEKSSGQFVYPSTVTRFISDSPASPKRSLEIILGLRPPIRASPFPTLDTLYMYILSQSEDWISVHDILAAQKIITSRNSPSMGIAFLLQLLGYTEDDILSSLADLTSIIRFWPGDTSLTVYHASLNDFLFDKHRAGDFYIDVDAFSCRLAPLLQAHF